MPFDRVTFTSDYGLADPFVGVCHAVIAGIAAGTRIIDLTHAVPAGDIRGGAVCLADCVGYAPAAVHLAVVDPGVGTARRGVVVRAADALLVGPDNGLLGLAAEGLGGIDGVWELTAPAYRLVPTSATFHGRDIFAPAAAHLARGVAPDALGPALDPADLVTVAVPAASVGDGRLDAEVVGVDRFGNVALAAAAGDLDAAGWRAGEPVRVRAAGAAVEAVVGRTFADAAPGGLVVHVDSFGHVAVAARDASAAARLGVGQGQQVRIRSGEPDAPPAR